MAKCIQSKTNPAEVQRVSDDEAAAAVKSGQWKYIPKKVYKQEQSNRAFDKWDGKFHRSSQ